MIQDYRVFIGVPTFNREGELLKCLESISLQTYKNFKVFISDNNSSDNSVKLLKKYCNTDDRFDFIVQSENIGWYENFKYLLECGSGYEYFVWAASDDRWSENYLDNAIKILDKNVDVACVQGEEVVFFSIETGNALSHIKVFDRLNKASRLETIACMFKRGYNLFIMGVFRTKILSEAFSNFPMVPSSDRYFLLQLPLKGWRIRGINNATYYRGIHEISAADRYRGDSYLEKVKISEKKIFDFSSWPAIGKMLTKSNPNFAIVKYIMIIFFVSRFKIGVLKVIKKMLKATNLNAYNAIYKLIQKKRK